MNSKHASALLRTFIRVFFSHYKYFIPFWLALAAFLVVMPLLLLFGKALSGQGVQVDIARRSIVSLMGPLLAVYDPIMIAIFSAAVLVAMVFDEIRWGITEHTLCVAPISVGKLILLKSLIGVLLVVPMALCIVAARILFIHLFTGLHYLDYVTPLHVLLLLANSFSVTLALTAIYELLILLTPSKYRTVIQTGTGLILVPLQYTVASAVLLHPETISAGDLYAYTALFAAVCTMAITLGYAAAEKMRDRIALNVVAP